MDTFTNEMQVIHSGVFHLKMIGFVTNLIMERTFLLQGASESSFQLSSSCSSVTSKGSSINKDAFSLLDKNGLVFFFHLQINWRFLQKDFL